jgi:hypothetical protein
LGVIDIARVVQLAREDDLVKDAKLLRELLRGFELALGVDGRARRHREDTIP